jgi:hypothetical protein
MKNKRAILQSLLVLFSVILLTFSGCGKKGPPLAPIIKGHKIAQPFDLKYTPGDRKIILFWKHSIDKNTAVVPPQGFEIFMAKKTFEACVECPLVFKPVGSVSIPAMEFMIRIEKGFKYYFRVQAMGEDNMRSDFSKTVQFEYQ